MEIAENEENNTKIVDDDLWKIEIKFLLNIAFIHFWRQIFHQKLWLRNTNSI